MRAPGRETAASPARSLEAEGPRSLLRLTASAAAGDPAIRVRVERGWVEEVLCEVDLDGAHYRLLRVRPAQPTAGLSPREREVATLVAQGMATKAIAGALSISAWTVCTHLRRIYARLGVGSRAAMVARLLEEGLL